MAIVLPLSPMGTIGTIGLLTQWAPEHYLIPSRSPELLLPFISNSHKTLLTTPKFNLAYSATNLEEFQILLTIKLLTQLLPHITITMSWADFNDMRRFNSTPAGQLEYDCNTTIVTDKVMDVKPYPFYGSKSRYVKYQRLTTPSSTDT